MEERLNDGYVYRELIDRRGAGRRVDDYLSARYKHSDLERWRTHIREGRVRLDGAACDVSTVLVVRQRLEYHRAPWAEPDVPLELPILYDHSGILVVAKPAGLPTMPGGGFLQHTLVHQLRGLDRHASPMHRLGRWTSGAVLCARSSRIGAELTAQFVARSIHKRYRALATGNPITDAMQIDVPIGPVPYAPLGSLHAVSATGRPASSHVKVLERRDDSFLAEITIATGRPHQIRIHTASLGHPLVGDPLYVTGGLPSPTGVALPGDPGYLLHSAEIGFDHPVTHARVSVHAPPPPLLKTLAERRP